MFDHDDDFYPSGDPRHCPSHPWIRTSSPDGMHDGLCGACEYAMEADEPVTHHNGRCFGCDCDAPVRTYTITASDLCKEPGAKSDVDYCEDCAELAAINWTGEIADCKPVSQ